MSGKINKDTCKQCVADHGFTWEHREDLPGDHNSDDTWRLGVVMCPTSNIFTKLAHIDAPPPKWCPYGFNARMRETTN